MSIKVTDLADLIWRDELDQTDQTSIPEIAYWIRNTGIGKLNNLLFTSFTINDATLEFSDNFNIEEAVILVQLYLVKYYQLRANNLLGAAGVSDTIEWTSDGHTIRKLNKNELSKTWFNLKTAAQEELNNLIGSYKIGKATPKDVSGMDVFLIQYPTKYYRLIE